MSEEKVTPIPRVKGTPRGMRPLSVRLTYYLTTLIGLLQLVSGFILYYEISIAGRSASALSLQPAALVAVIEIFSGFFAIIAGYGLRRLDYWGALSLAVFGVFEVWNGNLLAEVTAYDLTELLGFSLSGETTSLVAYVVVALGVILLALSAFSWWGIRRHRKVSAKLTG